MMVSPNFYYEEHIKGKSIEEIKKSIQELQSEIKRLIELQESGEQTQEAMMCPSPEVRVKVSRDYLEQAKKALIEAGGEYTPSEEEIISNEFDEHVQFIKKIVYERHIFFFGHVKYAINILKKSVKVEVEIEPNYGGKTSRTYEIDRDYLLDRIQEVHIGEWKSEYENYDILDGESWELAISFSDKYKKKKISGCNLWPWNWNNLMDALQIDEDDDV